MAYNSKHTGQEIDSAVDKIKDNEFAKVNGQTLVDVLKAKSNTDISVAQVRNIYFGTQEMEDGVTPLPTGTIYIQYTE